MDERRPPLPAAFQVGDRVRVRYAQWHGTVVGPLGPFGPGGCEIYRVELLGGPEPTFIDLRGDQLIVLKDKV